MAVISCTELDLDGKRDYTYSLQEGVVGRRTYLVQTDDATMTEKPVIVGAQSTGPNLLPRPFQLWPDDDFCMCHSIHPVRSLSDRTKWMVTCEYKTVFNQQEKDRSVYSNPLDRPTIVTGQSRQARRALRFCPQSRFYSTWPPADWSARLGKFQNGTVINSASDPLDPPIETDVTEWDIHCERNVAALPAWFFTYANGININDQVLYICHYPVVIPAGCGKLSGFTFSQIKQENGIEFITIGWSVSTRVPRDPIGSETSVPSPWYEERLDEGARVPSSNGVWEPVQVNGCPVTSPVPFNGAGAPIDTSGSPIPESSLKKVCFRPSRLVDYSVLPWSTS